MNSLAGTSLAPSLADWLLRLHSGELTPSALVERCLARIEALDERSSRGPTSTRTARAGEPASWSP